MLLIVCSQNITDVAKTFTIPWLVLLLCIIPVIDDRIQNYSLKNHNDCNKSIFSKWLFSSDTEQPQLCVLLSRLASDGQSLENVKRISIDMDN